MSSLLYINQIKDASDNAILTGSLVYINDAYIGDGGSVNLITTPAEELVSIRIEKDGYYTYKNNFVVPSYTTNLEIYLSPIVLDDNSLEYLKPYAGFLVFQDSYGKSIQILNNVSGSEQIINWYVNGLKVGSGDSIFQNVNGVESDFIIVQEKIKILDENNYGFNSIDVAYWQVVNYSFLPSEQTVLINKGVVSGTTIENYVENNNTISITVETPIPNLNITKTIEPTCLDEITTCEAIVDSPITFDFNAILNINEIKDLLGYNISEIFNPAEATLTYTFKNHDGEVIETDTFTYDMTTSVNDVTEEVIFTPSEIGDYTLEVVLDNLYFICSKTIYIKACDVLKLIEADCHVYQLYNSSLTDTAVAQLQGLDNINIGNPVTILPDSSQPILTTTDGIYKLIVTQDSVQKIFLIIDICDILKCYTLRLQQVLCSDCDCNCKDVDCKDYHKLRYDLTRLQLLWYVLYNYINKEYSLNSYYSVIDTAKLTSLFSVEDVMSKIKSICNDCSTNLPDIEVNGSSTLKIGGSNDCGCGCS